LIVGYIDKLSILSVRSVPGANPAVAGEADHQQRRLDPQVADPVASHRCIHHEGWLRLWSRTSGNEVQPEQSGCWSRCGYPE